MKKLMKKVISTTVALAMVITGFSCVGASAAKDIGTTLTHVGVSALEVIIRGVLGGLATIIPDSKNFNKIEDYKQEHFYEGTKEFLDEPADNAKWNLGYAKASLVPDDVLDKDKEYFLGGFMTLDNMMYNKVEEVVDDMQVRVIAIDDGSGRGVSIYANVDCIGFCHGDLLTVRKYFEEKNLDVDINAINLTSTHCHSCLDTQGLWTNGLPKILGNIFKSYIPFLEKTPGVNTEWLDWACHIIADTMEKAVNDQTEGDMTFAVKEVNADYFNNKNRKSSTSHCYEIYRFVFTPDDESKTPTMIVNTNAHPDVTGLATSDPKDNGRQISGDYVYWLGDTIENGGYNFMFFQGAIAGIYYGRGLSNDGLDLERRYMQAQRYGQEIGNICLNMTNSYDVVDAKYREIVTKEVNDEIEKRIAAAGDISDADKSKIAEEVNKNYSIWYENCELNPETGKYDLNWTPVEEREVAPLFNLKIDEVKVEVRNPLMKLVGKLELVNYDVYKEGLFKYNMFCEIGYAQFGDVKVAMMPGEIVQDLVYGGGSLTADGSFSGKDFGYKTIRELFGDDTIVFGLCNDAIGYVVPDNDYSLGIVDDHYQELISLGDRTASAIMEGFAKLADEIK